MVESGFDEAPIELPDEEHDVAMVVFCRAAGVDAHDAADRVRQALRRRLRPDDPMPLPHRRGIVAGREVTVAAIMELGGTAVNGYVWLKPTGRAFRELDERDEGDEL